MIKTTNKEEPMKSTINLFLLAARATGFQNVSGFQDVFRVTALSQGPFNSVNSKPIVRDVEYFCGAYYQAFEIVGFNVDQQAILILNPRGNFIRVDLNLEDRAKAFRKAIKVAHILSNPDEYQATAAMLLGGADRQLIGFNMNRVIDCRIIFAWKTSIAFSEAALAAVDNYADLQVIARLKDGYQLSYRYDMTALPYLDDESDSTAADVRADQHGI